jgi:hypothetical protein
MLALTKPRLGLARIEVAHLSSGGFPQSKSARRKRTNLWWVRNQENESMNIGKVLAVSAVAGMLMACGGANPAAVTPPTGGADPAASGEKKSCSGDKAGGEKKSCSGDHAGDKGGGDKKSCSAAK